MSTSGGSERSAIDLGTGLSQLGHKVYLWGEWTNFSKYIGLARNNGLEIIPYKVRNFLRETFALRAACKELSIDGIISNSRRYNIISSVATINLPITHIPVIRWMMSSWPSMNTKSRLWSLWFPIRTYIWYIFLRRTPVIACISHAVSSDVQNVLKCNSSKTYTIYNAIGASMEGIAYGSVNKERSPFRIIMVGRLSHEKHFELSVPLMAEILRFEKGIVASIAGTGECREELLALIKNSGLEEYIELLGHRDDIMKCYQNAHVLVHFGAQEAFGRIYLEAQMNGLPVVCVRGGASAEVVCDGKTGYVHDLNDISGMARSILRLKRDKVIYQQMSEAARKWAQDKFSVNTMAREYEGIIKELMDKDMVKDKNSS